MINSNLRLSFNKNALIKNRILFTAQIAALSIVYTFITSYLKHEYFGIISLLFSITLIFSVFIYFHLIITPQHEYDPQKEVWTHENSFVTSKAQGDYE
jgi:hypothetical protein